VIFFGPTKTEPTVMAYLSMLFKYQEILTKYLLNTLWLGNIFPILWLIEEKGISPPPWFKINFDSTISDTYSVQATVCCNHYEHIIKMDSQIIPMCLPNMREALAARLTTSLASLLNIKRFILERDFEIVIFAFQ
jgi:hypothetical protein